MRTFWTALAAALVTGCARQSKEDANPAPSSSLSVAQAEQVAKLWTLAGSGRSWCHVKATGSMLPIFDSRSILLLEPADASDLSAADIALYANPNTASADTLISHRVVEVRLDGILFDGDNNHGADGWVKPEQVRYRVAGMLFTRR